MWRGLTSPRDRCMNGRLFMISLPTPITMTVPPLRAVYAAVTTLLSTPVHSSTTSGAPYSPTCSKLNSSRICFELLSASRLRSTWYVRTEGTNFFANANLLGSRSVMTIGCAPLARAAASAMRPIGPAPHTTAPRPSDSPAELMPCMTTDKGSSNAPSA